MSIYVLPRATRDFDFIVQLQPQNVEAVVRHFQQGYYCDRDAINEALQRKTMFNIIDHASGFKADLVILKDSEYRRTEFDRRIKVDLESLPIYIVTAEDLLLSKLVWIQDLQSAIQMADIESLAALETLDLNTFGLLESHG